MSYDPSSHHRKSIRLKGYDYSQAGAYFITVCTYQRECLFGEIVDGEMKLNNYGEIVYYTWNDLLNHVPGIELGEFVVMPNHIHGIIIITDDVVGAGSPGTYFVGAGSEPAPTEPAPTTKYALPEIVRQLKTFSARRINQRRATTGIPVWQRNYWEHIIRNEESYNKIAEYIIFNPYHWENDTLFGG